MTTETVRELTAQEKEILEKRLREWAVAKRAADAAMADVQAKAAIYEDCAALVTGGDADVGIDFKAGTVVRKVMSDA